MNATKQITENEYRLMRKCDALLIAMRVIAAGPTIGGISAGERKGLLRAAEVAREAIKNAEARS